MLIKIKIFYFNINNSNLKTSILCLNNNTNPQIYIKSVKSITTIYTINSQIIF